MAVGWFGFAVLPWFGVEDGFFGFSWLFEGYPLDSEFAPALILNLKGEKPWLERWCSSRRCSCSTNRCPISTPS